jgi:hypothetical protein
VVAKVVASVVAVELAVVLASLADFDIVVFKSIIGGIGRLKRS